MAANWSQVQSGAEPSKSTAMVCVHVYVKAGSLVA